MRIEVESDHQGERVDQFLKTKLAELSRGQIQGLLKSGDIVVNAAQVKAKYPVQVGDVIEVEIPEPELEEAQPENIPVEMLFEDEHVIVVNKQPGLVVHPAAGNRTGTLVNALLYHCGGQLAPLGGEMRPGIVHRLDKDTSGCMVVAKTDQAHASLVKQFADRTTAKQYLTVVDGVPSKEEDRIFTNIGRHPVNRLKMAVVDPGSGKAAITDYHLLGTDEAGSSLILCDLHTGRTHQIRVHMLHLGNAIIGDPIYSKIKRQRVQTGRLMLHAWKLSFDHPVSGERLVMQAPIPTKFQPWTRRFLTSGADDS